MSDFCCDKKKNRPPLPPLAPRFFFLFSEMKKKPDKLVIRKVI